MSTAIQRRRGTTAQHSSFAGLAGELTVDTDKKTVVVHDGVTAGGMPLLPKTMTDGTANGVAYLNGSKVLTTGSALTFDTARLSFIKASNSRAWSADGDDLFAVENSTSANADFRTSTTGATYLMFSDTDARARGYVAYLHGSDSMPFAAAGSEQMRLTSTGLGIKTSSPAVPLHVYGGGEVARIGAYGTTTYDDFSFQSYAGSNLLTTKGATPLLLGTNNTERMRLDSSGNLGLGVTPSAWGGGFKAFELVGGSVFSGASTNLGIMQNAYYDGTNYLYKTTATAARYFQVGGQHIFYTAPSGTAGNAITFTQAMTLDASGNLLVGTTTQKVTVVTGGATGMTIGGASAPTIALHDTTDTSYVAYLSQVNDITYFGNSANGPISIGTGGTERARITSGGEVYIAGTTDQGAYNLQVNGTGVWGAGAYVNGSDRNLKDNIQSLDSCLDVVAAMRPVTFQYKPEHSKDQSVQPGFIAQELQEAMAGKAYIDGVVQAGPEYLNVAYQNIIPILVKAIQELKAEFDAYKATHP